MLHHQFGQPFIQHMGVNLGGGNIGVTQQGLDHPQIGPARQQMGGKGVAQGVGGHGVGVDAARQRPLLDKQVEPLA